MITIKKDFTDKQIKEILLKNPDVTFFGEKEICERIDRIRKTIEPLEVQNEYGIRENDLYTIIFENEIGKRIKAKDCKILNFAPCSNSAFKNESGLFIIRTCNIKEIIPKSVEVEYYGR